MKKTFTVNGKKVVFTDCTFEFDGATVDGLYIHDLDDVYHDGDGVIGNGCEMPDSDLDAEIILTNETMVTDFEILETVKFM